MFNVYRLLGKPGDVFHGDCILLKQEVIEEEQYDDGGTTFRMIVLAMRPGAVEPFVTWSRWITFNDDGTVRADDCCWGHYYRELNEKVMRDFDLRVGLGLRRELEV